MKIGDVGDQLNSDEFTDSDEIGEKKEKYNYHNDSDLESQMDDYKISEKSLEDSNEAHSHASDLSSEDENGEAKEPDEFSEGVAKVCKEMEHYYDKNYQTYLTYLPCEQHQEYLLAESMECLV